MTTLYSPSRDDARRFLVTAWSKQRAGVPLSALEGLAADVIGRHPEYHALLEDPDRSLNRDWPPESGQTNPFLHLALHLAVAEQLAVDQPAGIATEYRRLCGAWGDEHAAQHAVVECLGEVLWQAQRLGGPPDGRLYVDCLRRRR
jgi:hypothetical protein